MQMRLQEVFDKKQLDPNAMDACDDSIRCDAASFKEILPNISCNQIAMLVEKAYVGVTAGAGTRRRGSVDSGLPVGIRCAGGLLCSSVQTFSALPDGLSATSGSTVRTNRVGLAGKM